MLLAFVCLASERATAATVASDNGANYGSGWTTGNSGGSGWNANTPGWVVSLGSGASSFLISSGGIDTSGKSWGFYAPSGVLAQAFRYFNNNLSVGQVFTIDFQNGLVDSGGSTGFHLRAGGDTDAFNRFGFYFSGGANDYYIQDNSGASVDTGVAYTSSGLRIVFLLTGADTYAVTVLEPNTGTAIYTRNGTLVQGAGLTGNGPDRLQVWDFNNGGTSANNSFFNSISISTDAPLIATPPPAITGVCSGTTANVSITASNTDGMAISYAWRVRGSGWGNGGWTLNDGGGGHFVASNTPLNTAWGIWNTNGAVTEAIRPFPAPLSAGHSFSIDLANTNVASGASVGFGLLTSNGTTLFEFYFKGGGNDYLIHDASTLTRDTGVGFTDGGVNVTYTPTSDDATGPSAYMVAIKRHADNQTVILTGEPITFGAQQVRVFNAGAGPNNNLYVNNLSVNGADDNASLPPYGGTNWSAGYDGGQQPITNGPSGSGSIYTNYQTATLAIQNTQPADTNNLYDCAVMSELGYTTISSPGGLGLTPSQSITSQPGSQTVVCGSNAVFSVTATNATSYQWQRNGATLTDGGTVSGSATPTLSLTGVSTNDNGALFACLASGPCGSSTSTAATLTVQSQFIITTQPTDQTACSGSSASFTVGVLGVGFNYEWQNVYEPLENGGTISGANTPTLTLTGVSASDNGAYFICWITGCGTAMYSDAANLSVVVAPTINSQPTSQVVCVDGNASFAITGQATTYQWHKNGVNLTDGGTVSGSSTPTLTLTGVGASDSGASLWCALSSGAICGPSVTSSAAVLTVVSGVPAITNQPVSQAVYIGASANFSVGATNATAYSWRRNGLPLTDGGSVSGSATPTLTLTGVTAADNGASFGCSVIGTGPCSPVSSTPATLTVNSPPAITTQPVPQTVCLGGNAAFAVAATGTGLNYQWKENGTSLVDAGTVSGSGTPNLTLTGVADSDNGAVLSCAISGAYPPSVTSTTAVLTVNDAPLILIQPLSQTLYVGSNARFSVLASNAISYLWLKNGTALHDGGEIAGSATAALSLTGVIPGDTGVYEVVVANPPCAPVTSAAASLTVLPVPVTEKVIHSIVYSNGVCCSDLIQGSDGNLYGATYFTVFKVSPAGTFTPLVTGVYSNFTVQGGLTEGADGNFYGANPHGPEGGVIVQITPAGTLTTFYQFTGPDGSEPAGRLALGFDGNFYGVTSLGGTNGCNCGTVFRLTPAGALTTLYAFTNGADGSDPDYGLIQGSDGNFYGPTYGGGGGGTLFKITPAGTLTTIHQFAGAPAGEGGQPNLPVQGNDGNLYGTTEIGGTNLISAFGSIGSGTFYRMSPSGVFTTLYEFGMSGAVDGIFPRGAMIQGSDSYFYGTTSEGGTDFDTASFTYGNATVYRISPTGGFSVIYRFPGPASGPDGSEPWAGVVQGYDGNFYGTTWFGGSNGAGSVFEVSVPLNPSPNQINAIQQTNGNVTISLPAVLGETYQLQASDSLTPATWSNVPGASVTNALAGPLILTNFGPLSVTQQFYRLIITP